MNWSTEQQAIFEHFKSGTGNLVIEAFAGTGKTTTITEAFNHAPEARILYAVFNKRNQKEAEEKIQDHRVEVKTLHALGFSFIKRVWPNAKPDDQVEYDRINETLKPYPQLAQDKEFVGNVIQLVSFLKNSCINTTENDARQIAEQRGLLFDESYLDNRLIESALKVMELSKVRDKQGRISFNDMVWLPVACGFARPWFDLVCIDEAQDMNMPQLMMARQACKPGGRVVVVGDSRQAIYGFRGAVQNGMQMMKVTLKAKTLMLSTTYRCPKSVVKIASEIVPDYKAADSAPDGLVKSVVSADNATIGSAILSRLNAPLMPLALSFLRRNIPARIEGRDIGRQLIGMVRKFKAGDIQDLLGKLKDYEVKQVEKLQDAKNAEKKIEQVRDICETLSCIAESSSSVVDCESRLSNLFQDSTDKFAKPAIVLSSVHKAKGLEWDKVFILSETFNRKIKRTDANEEKNIYYVAVTRAKKELYLVNGEAGTPEGSLTSPVEEKCSITEIKADSEGFTGATQTRPAGKMRRPLSRASGQAGVQTVCADVPPAEILSGCEVNGETVPVAPVEKTGEGPAMADAGVSLAGSNPAIPTNLKCNPKVTNFDNFDVPPGQVRHKSGNVILYSGDEYVIIKVSSTSAIARCLSRKSKTVTNKLTDESKTFEQAPREIRISSCADKGSILRHIENFDPNKSGSVRNNKQQSSDDGENNMAKTKKEKSGNAMTLIVGMAKAGKSEKEIIQAVKSNYGQPSSSLLYIIGREWRRVNKVGRHFGTSETKKAAPKAKAKAKGAGASAPKKSKSGKPAAKKTPAPTPKAEKGDVSGVVAPPVPPARKLDAEVEEAGGESSAELAKA